MFKPLLLAALLVASTQVDPPVEHDVVPFLHAAFGLFVHELPAMQGVHTPLPLHTRFVPQPVPAALFVLSTQVVAPVVHDVVPFLHAAFGFELHPVPGTQFPQPPLLQT